MITLETMYFADEIRPAEGISPEKTDVSKAELDMAEKLIESFKGPFEPEKYEDTYRDALCEIIRAKRAGKEAHVEKAEAPDAAPDLLSALRASVETAQGRRAARRGRATRSKGDSDGELESLSKGDLYERAKAADVKGRADMSKEELIEALKAARSPASVRATSVTPCARCSPRTSC